MLKLDFKDKESVKFIFKQPSKQFAQIMKAIIKLTTNPKPNDYKHLKNYSAFRISVGEFRVIYDFDEDNLYILGVGKRNDDEVYKKFSRK